MAVAIPTSEKQALMKFEHDLKMEREKLRHDNAMAEIKLMGEAGVKSYQIQ